MPIYKYNNQKNLLNKIRLFTTNQNRQLLRNSTIHIFSSIIIVIIIIKARTKIAVITIIIMIITITISKF